MTGKEHQTLYTYDGRNRLLTITQRLCVVLSAHTCSSTTATGSNTYAYDGNDNRVQVTEDNGSGPVTTYYCYDWRNQLEKVSTGSSTCASGVTETYAYDAAGNRSSATGRTFTYDAEGQLATCTGTACSPVFDADGRLTKITTLANGTWSYTYDDESRLTSACQNTSCTGSGFARFDSTYDGEGHRIELKETTTGGAITKTVFTYAGDVVTSEVSTSSAATITRTFTTDDAGAIMKVTISGYPTATPDLNGDYLVTWNGHGDALALSKIDPTTGVLIPANRYTYSTWGKPETATLNGYADLGFRYLYVGRFDVQWDSSTAGLLYMHARHYSPEFGRFLQPDPAAAETNLFAYAENSPTTKADPSGTAGKTVAMLTSYQKGVLFERYVADRLRANGWRIVSSKVSWGEGGRIVDFTATKGGEVAHFEAKYGSSRYGGRQRAFDLEREWRGEGRTYVVRGVPKPTGKLEKVVVRDINGKDVTGGVFSRTGYSGAGFGEGRFGPGGLGVGALGKPPYFK